ncbi:hypothetical protein LJR230_004008 [Trinickia sp. LjRoot230]|uniref:thioesterase family protein n=1 Tax=Trinickia sp. LjRoot230 TaxID=3342288 RepID=UPI003ED07ED1
MVFSHVVSIPRWSVRVYHADTDAGRVAHHTAYLRWFEQARAEWLCANGLGARELEAQHDIAFALIEANLGFLQAAEIDQTLVIAGTASLASRCTFQVSQTLMRDGTPIARANLKLACVGLQSRSLAPLPEAFKMLFAREVPRALDDAPAVAESAS